MSEDMIAHKADNLIDEIVSKTASLRDRIESSDRITEESTPESYKERLNTWMQSSAKLDEEIFSRRLSYDQLGKDKLKTILSNEFRYPEDSIPAWSEKFDRILNPLSRETYEGILNDIDSVLIECKQKDIPFYHLIISFC